MLLVGVQFLIPEQTLGRQLQGLSHLPSHMRLGQATGPVTQHSAHGTRGFDLLSSGCLFLVKRTGEEDRK